MVRGDTAVSAGRMSSTSVWIYRPLISQPAFPSYRNGRPSRPGRRGNNEFTIAVNHGKKGTHHLGYDRAGCAPVAWAYCSVDAPYGGLG
ncbi:hypothetical protein EVAR_59683_1 [Eumeta japonica]|uniref:Uncharacterized protein n=1 Tax=Eumeta variegata TaxID=151549 RepID=A0A4C1YXS3_EUMVA|nr:hypothetical protein EVAR_59683_1 [Eumeta japonica]